MIGLGVYPPKHAKIPSEDFRSAPPSLPARGLRRIDFSGQDHARSVVDGFRWGTPLASSLFTKFGSKKRCFINSHRETRRWPGYFYGLHFSFPAEWEYDRAKWTGGGAVVRGQTRATTERAWSLAEGEGSEGGASERSFPCWGKRACLTPNTANPPTFLESQSGTRFSS